MTVYSYYHWFALLNMLVLWKISAEKKNCQLNGKHYLWISHVVALVLSFSHAPYRVFRNVCSLNKLARYYSGIKSTTIFHPCCLWLLWMDFSKNSQANFSQLSMSCVNKVASVTTYINNFESRPTWRLRVTITQQKNAIWNPITIIVIWQCNPAPTSCWLKTRFQLIGDLGDECSKLVIHFLRDVGLQTRLNVIYV